LVRTHIPETREGLARVALIRREELDGFVEGLFGKEQSLELPERAHRALDALSELRAIFDGLYELAGNPAKPVTADDIAQTRRHIGELTKVGEREIHEVVLHCTRARRQTLHSMPTPKPTLH
jgi:hypothetical protein